MKLTIFAAPVAFLLLQLFLIFSTSPLSAQAEEFSQIPSKQYNLEEIYAGKGVAWGFDFVDESKMLVSHRNGKLFLVNLKDKSKKSLKIPEVYSKRHGGLLDVHFKKIKDERAVYFTFSEDLGDGKVVTSLARGELQDSSLKGLKVIFQSNAYGERPVHFGSRIVFDEESLFMTVGERGERGLGQDITRHNGSILRLTFDGKPHPENPFIGKKGLDEIYSYGHLNPQGIDFHPKNKKLYSADMGPQGGDELNLIEKANNYGWPVITYGKEYHDGTKIGETHKEGMEQPVVHWVPSISPSGIVFYTGEKIKEWKNNLFLACLSGQQIRKLELKNNQVVSQTILFKDFDERFRHVRNGPDGHLYFSTDSGKIFKISSKK